jgi:hypothetical protein
MLVPLTMETEPKKEWATAKPEIAANKTARSSRKGSLCQRF